jgi:hypothetical protein
MDPSDARAKCGRPNAKGTTTEAIDANAGKLELLKTIRW